MANMFEDISIIHEREVDQAVKDGVPIELIRQVDKLDNDARLSLFLIYCRECGDIDPGCQCWNDE